MDEFNSKIKEFITRILNQKVKDKLKECLETENQQKIFIAALYELALVEYKGKLEENKDKINFTIYKTLEELEPQK